MTSNFPPAAVSPSKNHSKSLRLLMVDNMNDDLRGAADRLHRAIAAVDQAGELGEVLPFAVVAPTEPIGQSIPASISLPT